MKILLIILIFIFCSCSKIYNVKIIDVYKRSGYWHTVIELNNGSRDIIFGKYGKVGDKIIMEKDCLGHWQTSFKHLKEIKNEKVKGNTRGFTEDFNN